MYLKKEIIISIFIITISAPNLYMPMIWLYVFLLDVLIPFLCDPGLQCMHDKNRHIPWGNHVEVPDSHIINWLDSSLVKYSPSHRLGPDMFVSGCFIKVWRELWSRSLHSSVNYDSITNCIL